MLFDRVIDKLELPEGIVPEELGPCAILLRGSRPAPLECPTWGPAMFPGLRRYVAWALTSHFVTSPFFGTSASAVPERCQVFLWEDSSGGFGVLLPVLDGDYRSEAFGMPDGLGLRASCGPAGKKAAEIALAVVHFAVDPYEALRGAMTAAVRWMDRGKLREEKSTPRWIDLLGWCTWDAFYTEVDEEKVLAGLLAFQASGFVPGHVIIDEGWQDCSPKKYLLSFGLKSGAFTDDRLKTLIKKARDVFGVKMIGCWRTLFGQLRGVDVESPGLCSFQRRLVNEPGTDGDTFGVIEPGDVARFHDEYAAHLEEQGVDFVKVDFQSALHLMTYGQTGRAAGARLWQHSLQDSVEKHFHGEMLNCMSLGSDEIFHAKTSNVARSSDDYFPTKDDSHPAHIRQNAYNALWLSHLQWPDWDMFHSRHPWAFYHAIGRAISGGPVYVSDKPGESDCALLRRFLAADGHTLRCPQPSLPVRSQIFEDSVAGGKMIRVFNRCGAVGLLALFHPSDEPAAEPLEEEVEVCEIEGQAAVRTAVYSVTRGFLGVWDYAERQVITLDARDADLLVFSPVKDGIAPLGLIGKFNPPAAILSFERDGDTVYLEARGGGEFGVFLERAIREVRLDGVAVESKYTNQLLTFDTGHRAVCRIIIRLE